MGILSCENGYSYDGEFAEGKKHGKGTESFTDGSKFVGTFINGKPLGHGILT